MTTQEIYEGMSAHGGVVAWAQHTQRSREVLLDLIREWHRATPRSGRVDLAINLLDAGVSRVAISAIIKITDIVTAEQYIKARRYTSTVERSADAAHVQHWGHV